MTAVAPPRAVWVTSKTGKGELVWTYWSEVDVDLSDLIPEPAPRSGVSVVDLLALQDLQRGLP